VGALDAREQVFGECPDVAFLVDHFFSECAESAIVDAVCDPKFFENGFEPLIVAGREVVAIAGLVDLVAHEAEQKGEYAQNH
jgi:hypothetical protein